MNEPVTIRSRVGDLARRIEDDIHRRGLSTGEPYLTADEVARRLGVHSQMASRAMRVLADRGVLDRRRGVGTFIGPGVNHDGAQGLQFVHVLVAADRVRTGLSSGDVLDGLREVLPGHDVQINYLPEHGAEQYVRQVFEKGAVDGTLAGAVLLGCPLSIQQYVCAEGVPAVVFGTVYASTRQLPSVDVDHVEMGRQMARYLIARNEGRIALVLRDHWLAGDNQLLDGVHAELDAAGRRVSDFSVRSLPTDLAVDRLELQALLSGENRPAAILCRGRLFAEAILETAQALNLAVPEQLGFICEHSGAADEVDPGVPHVRARLNFREQAALVGRLLADLLEGKQPDKPHRVMPVELCESRASAASPAAVPAVSSSATASSNTASSNSVGK